MRGHKASIRYAKSLIDLALSQEITEAVYKDVILIKESLRANRELVVVLKSPIIKQDKKSVILSKVFENKLGDLTQAFIKIIVLKKRESMLVDICNDYIHLYKEHKNIITAEVKTAAVLSDATKKKIGEMVKSIAEGNLEIIETVDLDLIGGFVIKVGDKQIDESISQKLNKINREFSHNPYIVKL
jgi:F-type H+-transporting ATPase subunit delta